MQISFVASSQNWKFFDWYFKCKVPLVLMFWCVVHMRHHQNSYIKALMQEMDSAKGCSQRGKKLAWLRGMYTAEIMMDDTIGKGDPSLWAPEIFHNQILWHKPWFKCTFGTSKVIPWSLSVPVLNISIFTWNQVNPQSSPDIALLISDCWMFLGTSMSRNVLGWGRGKSFNEISGRWRQKTALFNSKTRYVVHMGQGKHLVCVNWCQDK